MANGKNLWTREQMVKRSCCAWYSPLIKDRERADYKAAERKLAQQRTETLNALWGKLCKA